MSRVIQFMGQPNLKQLFSSYQTGRWKHMHLKNVFTEFINTIGNIKSSRKTGPGSQSFSSREWKWSTGHILKRLLLESLKSTEEIIFNILATFYNIKKIWTTFYKNESQLLTIICSSHKPLLLVNNIKLSQPKRIC